MLTCKLKIALQQFCFKQKAHTEEVFISTLVQGHLFFSVVVMWVVLKT